ncbi:MAG TPA: hypothetical protein VGR40_04525, partial [Candidatus Binatus sp.]|nr:hypothetical protein [Candidatus Binatus sp.]
MPKEDFQRSDSNRSGLNPGSNHISFEEPNALAHAVRKIAIGREHAFDKKRSIAELIVQELTSHGELYRTVDGCLSYLPNEEGRPLELGRPEFADLVMERSGLGQTDTFLRFALDRLKALARGTVVRELRTLSHYDETTGTLAVSDAGSGMWVRERGGDWQYARNGANGVVFRTDPEAEPWAPEFPSNPDPAVFEHLRWFLQQVPIVPRQDLWAHDQRILLEMAMLQRFFPPLARTRLIPAFLGPPGSGKSTAQRLIGRLLVGPRFELSDLRADGYDGFVAAITNRVIYAIDNLDRPPRWLEDALARYATGIAFTKKRPYTLNEPVSHT